MMRLDECLRHLKTVGRGHQVTQDEYDEFRERKDRAKRPVASISPDEVKEICTEQFWRPLRASALPRPLDFFAFEAALEDGACQTIRWLKTLAGCEGVPYGKETTDALHAAAARMGEGGVNDLCAEFMLLRRGKGRAPA